MTTQKGTIITWLQDKNFGFIQPEGTEGRDAQIFMHASDSNLPFAKLREGTVVEYEATPGRKGLKAANVRLPGDAMELPPQGYRFHNPYNFVRTLPYRQITSDASASVQLMGRTVPPTHDRWLGLSGQIKCQLETITPLFISDAEEVVEKKKIGEKKKHYQYRFFRLNGEKAVPASSLRGVVRSVFEAATNSSFSHFGGEQLSYRLPSGEVQKLVPARVEKIEKDGVVSWHLRLLPGSAPFAPEVGQKKGLYAAPARFYAAVKPTGRRRQDPIPPIGDPDQWQHGKAYYGVLRQMKFPPSWRVLDLCETQEEAEKRRAKLASTSYDQLVVKQGWLCKTNQNSDNKNSERFFYAETNRADVPELIPLPVSVCEKYEALIQDYQKRHESDVKKRKQADKLEGQDIAYSRFVLNKKEAKLRGGELVYVSLLGRVPNLKIMFIAPVSWPRVAYDHTIAELLPPHLRRPDSYDLLDPASRVFGWVQGEKEKGAYAGRVNFTHALLKQSGEVVGEKTLAILGSPKPTTTRFYLAQPNGKPSSKPRDDISVGYDGNNGRNQLRGRKMYRHFIPDEKHMTSEEATDQNRSIKDAEGAGALFTFSVNFENLAPVELGALLWSLTLDGKGYHKLGYGKPLGLGSAKLSVSDLVLYDQVARYQSLTDGGERPLSPSSQSALIDDFREAMCRHYVTNQEILTIAEERGAVAWKVVFEDLPNVADILTLLNIEEPELPVHYPYSPDNNSQGQFEWFVGNNRLHGPRIELGLATESEGLPLIDKKGSRL